MNLIRTTRKIQRLVGVKADGIYGPNTAAAVLAALQSAEFEEGEVFVGDPVANDQPFDRRTEKNLKTLQPGAQQAFRPFVRRAIAVAASMGVDLKVICGERNRKDQEDAKRRGASKAGFGYSWHNYGMAIDFGCFSRSKYLDSTDPRKAEAVYAALGALASSFGMEWGGSWRSFKDTPHFHVDTGHSTPTAADRRALAAGTFSF